MKYYRESTKAWRIKFADNLKIELGYYRAHGYNKIKLDKLVGAIQSKYQGATFDRTKKEVIIALEKIGVSFDDKYVYLKGSDAE